MTGKSTLFFPSSFPSKLSQITEALPLLNSIWNICFKVLANCGAWEALLCFWSTQTLPFSINWSQERSTCTKMQQKYTVCKSRSASLSDPGSGNQSAILSNQQTTPRSAILCSFLIPGKDYDTCLLQPSAANSWLGTEREEKMDFFLSWILRLVLQKEHLLGCLLTSLCQS